MTKPVIWHSRNVSNIRSRGISESSLGPRKVCEAIRNGEEWDIICSKIREEYTTPWGSCAAILQTIGLFWLSGRDFDPQLSRCPNVQTQRHHVFLQPEYPDRQHVHYYPDHGSSEASRLSIRSLSSPPLCLGMIEQRPCERSDTQVCGAKGRTFVSPFNMFTAPARQHHSTISTSADRFSVACCSTKTSTLLPWLFNARTVSRRRSRLIHPWTRRPGALQGCKKPDA